MDGVIIPTLVPPPLSPFSSFSSDTPSLRKSLSKKSPLQKILSVTKCNNLHDESIEASATARSEAVEESSPQTSSRTEAPSIGIGSLLPPFVKRYSTEGSMDVDDYCAVQGDQSLVNGEDPDAKRNQEDAELVVRNVDAPEKYVPVEVADNCDLETAESFVSNDEVMPDDVVTADVADNAVEEKVDEDEMDTNVYEKLAKTTDTSADDAGHTDNAVSMPGSSEAVKSTTPASATVPTTPLNGGPPPIEILISFDTTGSMSYYLDEVKNEVNNIIHRLFMDIPNLKIGVVAHGDYCDASVYYLTQTMDLTSDVEGLCTMVKNVEGTGGGDFEECYELIFRMARQVKWTPGSQRALVMIGDACPHTTDDLTTMGKEPIDWKVEAAALRYEMGVQIYGVQCQDHTEAGTFWQDLANLTHGEHLKLDKFATIIDIILAICYRESGPNHLQAYELEVRAREGRMLATELDQAFQVLRGGAPKGDVAVTPCPSTSKPTSKAAARVAPKKTKLIAPAKTKPQKEAVQQSKGRKDTVNSKGKGTRAPKPKNPKRVVFKKSKQPIRRLLREQVTEAHFMLNQLKWTPWIKVISQHDHGALSIWQKRHRGIGYKCSENLGILDKFIHKSAVYELAVQLQPRGKQIVVYNHVTKGMSGPSNHWSRLVFKSNVNKFIDNLLHQCPTASVSVRRAFLQRNRKLFGQRIGSAETCRALIKRSYDYAWKGQKPSRTLVKKGVTIVTKDTSCS